jgi:hypothetical protein
MMARTEACCWWSLSGRPQCLVVTVALWLDGCMMSCGGPLPSQQCICSMCRMRRMAAGGHRVGHDSPAPWHISYSKSRDGRGMCRSVGQLLYVSTRCDCVCVWLCTVELVAGMDGLCTMQCLPRGWMQNLVLRWSLTYCRQMTWAASQHPESCNDAFSACWWMQARSWQVVGLPACRACLLVVANPCPAWRIGIHV